MASWFDSFFKGGNWLPAALLAGATIYSATASSDANKKGAAIQADAINRSTALANQRFQQVQDQTAPAVAYQKQVIQQGANPALTPAQKIQVDDARRSTIDAMSVSGLRGSGKAVTDAVRRVESGTVANLFDQNQRRADTAASGLSNQFFGAANQMGANDMRAGYTTGQIGADVTTADATLRGRALGDIATIVGDAAREGRKGAYENRTVGQVDQKKTMAG